VPGGLPHAVQHVPGGVLLLAVEGQPHLPRESSIHAFRTPLPHRRDVALAEHFGARSGEDGEKFSGVEHEIAQSGVPLVSALPHRMLVKRIATLDDGGDHVCITARVVTAESRTPFTPLRTSDVSHIVPGHDSDERVIRP